MAQSMNCVVGRASPSALSASASRGAGCDSMKCFSVHSSRIDDFARPTCSRHFSRLCEGRKYELVRNRAGGNAIESLGRRLEVADSNPSSKHRKSGSSSPIHPKSKSSTRRNSVNSYVEDLEEITETKEEVADVSENGRLSSTYLDKGGTTKLVSVQDYMEHAPEMIRPDLGPPRWFCSLDAEGFPSDAPVLLFLPGMDSLGLGLLLHQKKLARLFEVQCLHIPLKDRTTFIGLVEIVEQRVREEYNRKRGPVYLLGESFGGCLALAVAARNPDLDIVLVIVNPATSFERSPLQPFIPLLESLPDPLFRLTPFLLSFTMGNPVRMATASVDSNLPPWEKIPKIADALRDLLPTLPVLADIMPRDVLQWKIKLLNDGARYTNARLGGISSDILLLVSGQDQMLPSKDEARQLKKLLPQIKMRLFPNSGHTLLLEEGLDVASMIKTTQILRHKKNAKFDPIEDFRTPFPDEVEVARNSSTSLLRRVLSPVFLSAAEDGTVRRGVPQQLKGRPILFVGNHTLIGFDLGLLEDELLREGGILLRGLAHPILSQEEDDMREPGMSDIFNLFGTVPVAGTNLYKLLARGDAVLLYPGGVREALKRKGEKYKLFWSETAEFVRTAIRHGATIVPFASVGGDDLVEIVLDSKELLSLPFIGDSLRKSASDIPLARSSGRGEVLQEDFVTPLGIPQIPTRIYFLFKPPISTEGMLDSIKDKTMTMELYMKTKGEVESALDYLLQMRTKDPYKDFFPRIVYEATNGTQAPSFDS